MNTKPNYGIIHRRKAEVIETPDDSKANGPYFMVKDEQGQIHYLTGNLPAKGTKGEIVYVKAPSSGLWYWENGESHG